MSRSIFNTQLTLPLKADYRKSVTNICTKTLSVKMFQQMQAQSGNSNLPDMRTYINSQNKTPNNAKSYGPSELYSPENKG